MGIPVPGGGLHVLADPGGSSSPAVSRDERGEGFFRTFPRVKTKSEVRRESESEGTPPGRAHGLRRLTARVPSPNDGVAFEGLHQDDAGHVWSLIFRHGSCSVPTVVDISTVAQTRLGLQTARQPSTFHGFASLLFCDHAHPSSSLRQQQQQHRGGCPS